MLLAININSSIDYPDLGSSICPIKYFIAMTQLQFIKESLSKLALLQFLLVLLRNGNYFRLSSFFNHARK